MCKAKLFCVRHGDAFARDPDGEIAYFANKMMAKVLRDKLGEGWRVSKGPDHIRYLTDEAAERAAFRPAKGKGHRAHAHE